MSWDSSSIRGRFERSALLAEAGMGRVPGEIARNPSQRERYESEYDHYLAEFYVYNRFITSRHADTGDAMVTELRRLLTDDPIGAGAKDNERFLEFRRTLLRRLLTEFGGSADS